MMKSAWRTRTPKSNAIFQVLIVSLILFCAENVISASILRNSTTAAINEKQAKNFDEAFPKLEDISKRVPSTRKPKIQVFYEVLCPYSRNYLVHEFIPAIVKLKDHVEYEFIPYGNANITNDARNMSTFNCQHGPVECDGNMIHACAIEHFDVCARRFSPGGSDNEDDLLGFLGCTILNNFPDTAEYYYGPNRHFQVDPEQIGKNCAQRFELDWEQIALCWKGQEGIDLLKRMGEKTMEIEPTIKSVPLVVFNGLQNYQIRLRSNLLNFLCNYIMENNSNREVVQECHEELL